MQAVPQPTDTEKAAAAAEAGALVAVPTTAVSGAPTSTATATDRAPLAEANASVVTPADTTAGKVCMPHIAKRQSLTSRSARFPTMSFRNSFCQACTPVWPPANFAHKMRTRLHSSCYVSLSQREIWCAAGGPRSDVIPLMTHPDDKFEYAPPVCNPSVLSPLRLDCIHYMTLWFVYLKPT